MIPNIIFTKKHQDQSKNSAKTIPIGGPIATPTAYEILFKLIALFII